ncbi:MAG TPA: CPBP family intramembrane glutamic endopeptidase [Thermoanaerobaculia bacterium]|nr:CPBP family intramembrane glutamic endopeptidase [Thermoanaerobaculia bacterium]
MTAQPPSRIRFLLGGLLELGVAVAFLAAAIAACHLLVVPLLVGAFSLGDSAASFVRRTAVLLAVVLSYWAFVRLYLRRPVRELAPRLPWTLLAGAAGALSIGVTILALFLSGHYLLAGFRGWAQAPDVLGQILVAAVIEEVAFRGILLQTLERRIGTAAALGVSAGIFGAVHLANDGARWITLLSVTLAGLIWSSVFLLTRNVWVSTAHHACWNATIWAVGLPLSGEEAWRALAPFTTVTHGSDLWTGGAFGPEDSLVNLAVSAALCWGLLRLGSSPRWRGSSGPPAPSSAGRSVGPPPSPAPGPHPAAPSPPC